MAFHEEELSTISVIEEYAHEHRGIRYKITFDDGACYLVKFDTAYEDDNEGDGAEDERDPNYDEFYTVVFEIIKTITPGPHNYNEFVSVSYKHFPTSIVDVNSGNVVYPKPQSNSHP